MKSSLENEEMFMGYSSEAEEFPMTLQIGLIGHDGVVIASDRCMVIAAAGARQTSLTTKFHRAGNKDVLFAFSGMDLADLMAHDFAEAFESADDQDFPMLIKESYDRHFTSRPIGHRPQPVGSILSLINGSLFATEIQWDVPFTKPIFNKIVLGDARNSASFFSERYYPKDRQPSVAEIIPLAASVVYFGAKLSPSVEGLEIAVYRATTGLSFIGPSEITALMARFDSLDATLMGDMLKPQL